jgi:hypothetical protein
MINEKMIEAKGPNKVTFKELVQVSIQRLKDPKTSIYKKEQAAISLLAMADALDRHPEAMEKINKRKRKLDFNAADAREWLESRADQGGVLMCLIDGTFSPSDVAKEISTYKKEQEEDRTLSLRIQRNADWIKQQNKEID